MTLLHDKQSNDKSVPAKKSHQMMSDSSDIADNVPVGKNNSLRITSGSTGVAD